MIEPSEKNPVCIECGLFNNCKTPFMESSGSEEPDLLVIGEAPGADEDRQGIPFVGESGRLLRTVIKEVGFDDHNVRFTNVVRCRPEDNKITKAAINHCKAFVLQDIETYDPAMVFLMGNTPMNAVLGETGISQWNGVSIEQDERVFVPLFHPAYILRNSTALDEWLTAIIGAVEGVQKRVKFERLIPQSVEEVLEMQDYLSEYEYISFDTETSTLDPYREGSKILSVSFAAGEKSFSLPIDHKESWWGKESTYKQASDYDVVRQVVMDTLQAHDSYIICQNTKFDQMQIYALFGMMFSAGGDSMLVSHMLDSRQGIHGLKRLAAIHLGMYEYEKELTDYVSHHIDANPYRGGSYDNIPLDILLPYGGMDAEAALLVHNKLYLEMSEKQQIFYDQVVLPASDALCEMQCNGIVIDRFIAERYRKIYTIKRDEAYEKLMLDKHVLKMVKQVQKELDDARKPGSRARRKIFTFNPNSPNQLRELYYKRYKIPPVVLKNSKTGLPTTSGSALRNMEERFPILKDVRYYKLLSKMLSTYLIPAASGAWLSGDGRARTTYNLHGTKTGRLSSSGGGKKGGMNLQNIPTPEKEPNTLLEILPIKNMFTHSYLRDPRDTSLYSVENGMKIYDYHTMYGDGAIMSVDYSGMELRVFASLARCEPMLEIHRSGLDFHSCVGIRATTGKPISDITQIDIDKFPREIRYRYKWTNWTLLYGGDAWTLVSLYGMNIDEAERLVSDYYNSFPEVLRFKEECIEFAESYGYIESPYGRREHLYYITDRDRKKRNQDIRAAVNMPVQSAASDTLLISLIIVRDKLSFIGARTKLVNTVHDSIVLDAPREEVATVAGICKDVMENVAVYAKDYMPNVDMSWLVSPLKADVEVGSHYGSVMHLDKWMEEFNVT